MFCPQCGQERVSAETNYCSRCGFLLTAVTDLLHTGGQNPLAVLRRPSQPPSARRRGLKQGLFIFLLTFLVAPLVGMLSMALGIRPFGVGIAVVLFFFGGLMRMVYALMFESEEPGAPTLEEKVLAGTAAFKGPQRQRALPPESTESAFNFISPGTGNWRDTNELQPTSVVEGTTKLLDHEDR